MSSDLQALPEALHTFCPIAALSRVYAGPSGESNEKLWIQEVAWHEEPAHGFKFTAWLGVSIVNSAGYRNSVARRREPLFWSGNSIDSHIWPQYFRYCDGTIRLLIILYNRNPRAPNSQSRPIQRVHKLAFPSAFGLEPDACAPRLKRLAIRTRRNLAELIARGQPRFQVIRFRRGESHISRGEQHGPVMQPQFLQNGFRVAHQRFMLLVTFLRMRKLEQFHLLKLMLPQDAPRIFSGRARFRTEASGPRRDVNRQLVFCQRRLAIQIVQLHFRSRCQPEIRVLDLEQIRREFRQLPGTH